MLNNHRPKSCPMAKILKTCKILFFILSIWLLFYISVFCQNNASPISIRVLTYNILHGATVNNDYNIELIARVITSASPDIVALQEVDFKTKRAKEMDLATRLGNLTGFAPLFGRAMYYDNGEYGEGILSRYSFIKTSVYPLPFSPGNEPRTALQVTIQLQGGDEIMFIGTHLDHTRPETDRINQAKKINELFKDINIPMILVGDFNATPDSEPIKILSQYWIDACGNNPQPTFPSANPKQKIDYIMYRPADRWRVVETRIIDEKVASDHCPLFAILELLPGKRN